MEVLLPHGDMKSDGWFMAESWNKWLTVVEPTHFEKYARQIGSFPQVGVKKKCLKPPPSLLLESQIFFLGRISPLLPYGK